MKKVIGIVAAVLGAGVLWANKDKLFGGKSSSDTSNGGGGDSYTNEILVEMANSVMPEQIKSYLGDGMSFDAALQQFIDDNTGKGNSADDLIKSVNGSKQLLNNLAVSIGLLPSKDFTTTYESWKVYDINNKPSVDPEQRLRDNVMVRKSRYGTDQELNPDFSAWANSINWNFMLIKADVKRRYPDYFTNSFYQNFRSVYQSWKEYDNNNAPDIDPEQRFRDNVMLRKSRYGTDKELNPGFSKWANSIDWNYDEIRKDAQKRFSGYFN